MIRLAVSEMLYETAKLYRFIVSRVHQNHAYPPSENTTEQNAALDLEDPSNPLNVRFRLHPLFSIKCQPLSAQ